MTAADKIAGWMRRRLLEAGSRGFLFGLSGGIDSAVVARLCQMAAPGAALGVLLPCHSDPQDEHDARLVAEKFALPTVRIDLEAAYDALVAATRPALTSIRTKVPGAGEPGDARLRLALANVKPRLRMTALYFAANHLDFLVAGTGNRSELAIGYFTKYGDGGVDLLPLGHLLKSEVRALARDLNVPQAVIDKPPSAGLWLGQTDENEMGFTYAELETHLTRGAAEVAPAVAMRIERLARSSDHKRRLPPVYEDE